jgi:release factor glutamine methyltransferase
MQLAALLLAAKIERLDAEILLAHILDVSRERLLIDAKLLVSAEQQAEFEKLVVRRQAGEPVAQLIGERDFFGLTFQVTPDVLIPRPETEQLVETVIQQTADSRQQTVIDVGTGSGCIAVALAYHLPNLKVSACDVSEAALKIAKKNAAQHKVQIQFHESDLLESVPEEYQIVVANLPYIADGDPVVEPAVKQFEPSLALFAGPTGLELYEKLLAQIAAWQIRPKLFLGEIGWQQGDGIIQMTEGYLPGSKIEILKDLAGHDRIITIRN